MAFPYQNGTFNTIGTHKAEIGGHFPVWSRVDKIYQGGGTIDLTGLKAGDVIGAGTMVIFAGPGKQVEIVKADGAEAKLAQVNGLIMDDVCIPTGCTLATCAVVRAGRIYADRAANGAGIPASVEANLPMIEFVRED